MKKFDNLQAAIHNLKDIYSYQAPYGNVEMTGMVGLYEICFEQAWKAMKEILTIEELWLSALTSRNNVAHAYNQAIALDIIRQAKTKYYDMFVELVNEIQKNWL